MILELLNQESNESRQEFGTSEWPSEDVEQTETNETPAEVGIDESFNDLKEKGNESTDEGGSGELIYEETIIPEANEWNASPGRRIKIVLSDFQTNFLIIGFSLGWAWFVRACFTLCCDMAGVILEMVMKSLGFSSLMLSIAMKPFKAAYEEFALKWKRA